MYESTHQPIYIYIYLLSFFAQSCNSSAKINLTTAPSASSSLTAKSLSPIAAKPGEVVKLNGQGFSSKHSASVKLTGLDDVSKTAEVKFVSGTEASFVMPEGLGLGLKSVAVTVNGKELTESLRMVADSDTNSLPILIVDQSEVCSTLQYVDKNGDTQTGTKDCGGAAVAECFADGAIGCKTTASFPAASAALAIAGNIKNGVTIAGVAGSATLAPANCSSAGQQSCIATGTYYAGTACSTNGSACYLPAYASGSQDKKAVDYSTIDASKMLDSLTVSGVTGTVVTRGALNLTNSFPGAGYYSSASNTPSASTIASGTTINGVAGSATLAPANCSSNAAIGCVTTSTYQSADLTNLAEGNIKNGVTIAGVAGLYPNSTYTLTSASAIADLDAATFDAKVKSATAFEYWDSSRARQTGAGDADIVAGNIATAVSIFGTTGTVTPGTAPSSWDVRAGVVINGVTGKLRYNCRNGVKTSTYNYDGAASSIPSSNVTSGTVADWWDVTDNYSGPYNVFPAGWSSALHYCGGLATTDEDDNVWKDVTVGGCQASKCRYKDKISGLEWTKPLFTSRTWPQAVNDCDSLTLDSQSDWRLPTLNELAEANSHGIYSVAHTSGTNWFTQVNLYGGSAYWSASNVGQWNGSTWARVGYNFGYQQTPQYNYTTSVASVSCVR